MGNYDSRGRLYESSQYVTVAASQTTAALGGKGSYLESVTIVPVSSAAQPVTVLDGTVSILTIPTAAFVPQPLPVTVHLGIRSASTSEGGFAITTGTSASVIAVGKFAND